MTYIKHPSPTKDFLAKQGRLCNANDGINQKWTRIEIPNGIRLSAIYNWAEGTLVGDYKLNTRYVFFEEDADATLFQLRWAGN